MTAPHVTEVGDKGLHITLSDGGSHYFNYYWLRDNCPSSFSSVTRERSFDIFHLDAAPRPNSAVVDGDALVIDWAGEDHVTRMPLDWLDTYKVPKPRPDPADLPRVAWYSDHYPTVPRFSQPELVADKTKRAAFVVSHR